MRARAASLGADVTAYLDGLVSRGHSALYGARSYSLFRAVDLLVNQFPRTLREHRLHFATSAALFFVPFVTGWSLALGSEEFAFGILPREHLEQAEASYAEGFAEGRGAGADSTMAGYYIQHNVGIAFRCFATGILFGAGSVFFLFYNGLAIGTMIGFIVRRGSGSNILAFICGHAPFELTAIVISGAAGLKLGHSLIATRGLTRLGSLRAASRPVANLILGAAVLLLFAAVIEGFWSPSSVSDRAKWTFSAVATVLIAAFLLLSGRVKPG
jgi:uncharacterized membrane protein SpoIIM required for sporulation